MMAAEAPASACLAMAQPIAGEVIIKMAVTANIATTVRKMGTQPTRWSSFPRP